MADVVDDMPFARARRTEQMRRLVDAVSLGANVTEACEYVRISRQTWYRWRERGERGEAPYAQLLEQIRIAERAVANSALRAAIADLAQPRDVAQ